MTWVNVFDLHDTLEQKRAGVRRYYAAWVRDQILDLADGRPIEPDVLEQMVDRALAKMAPLIEETLTHVDPSTRH